jgi:hypothetical protein
MAMNLELDWAEVRGREMWESWQAVEERVLMSVCSMELTSRMCRFSCRELRLRFDRLFMNGNMEGWSIDDVEELRIREGLEGRLRRKYDKRPKT